MIDNNKKKYFFLYQMKKFALRNKGQMYVKVAQSVWLYILKVK